MFVISQMNDLHLLSISEETKRLFSGAVRSRGSTDMPFSNEPVSIGKVALLELFVLVYVTFKYGNDFRRPIIFHQ
jgi:hypothetical protein